MEEIAETLRCQICLEFFKDPKILPCNHTFCKTCIEQYMTTQAGNNFPCPSCRAEHPKIDSNNYPNDFSKKSQIDIVQNHSSVRDSCKLCHLNENPSEDVVATCLTCEFRLCHPCLLEHNNKMPNHQVHLFDLPNRIKKCPQHSDNLNQFCLTCGKLICYSCIFQKLHEDHEYVQVSAKCNGLRSDLDSLIQSYSLKRDNMKIHTRLTNEISTSGAKKIAAVSKKMKKIHDKLQQIEEKATHDINEQVQLLSAVVDEKCQHNLNLPEVEEFLEKLQSFQTLDDISLLESVDDFQNLIEESEEALTSLPDEVIRLWFKSANNPQINISLQNTNVKVHLGSLKR